MGLQINLLQTILNSPRTVFTVQSLLMLSGLEDSKKITKSLHYYTNDGKILNPMATYNCFLDTHVLSDFLFQFDSSLPNNSLEPKGFLTNNMLQRINPLIEGEGRDGVVITSVFNFVEVLNKLDDIYGDDVKKMRVKLYGFLNQTPEWFLIDDMNISTANTLIDVPIRNHFGESISEDDAILIATALLRDNVLFCTYDNRLEDLNIKNMSFIR